MQVSALRVLIMAALLPACGAAGGPEGGGDNLPDRGVIPYEKVTATEEGPPFVFMSEEGAEAVAPAALVRGDTVDLFFERRPSDGPAQIARVQSIDGGLTFGPAQVMLQEEGGLGAPSAALIDGAVVLAVERGGGIALAEQVGDTFVLAPDNALEPATNNEVGELGGPSLLQIGADLHLFYHARPLIPDPDDASILIPGPPAIYLAIRRGSGPFERYGAVLEPGLGCTGGDGLFEACWDAGGVESPEVRLATTGTGRRIFRMMYAGLGSGSDSGVGFAASFDGQDWGRFEFNPILAATRRERAPSNIRAGQNYLLYFTDRVGGGFGVGQAALFADNPTESF